MDAAYVVALHLSHSSASVGPCLIRAGASRPRCLPIVAASRAAYGLPNLVQQHQGGLIAAQAWAITSIGQLPGALKLLSCTLLEGMQCPGKCC